MKKQTENKIIVIIRLISAIMIGVGCCGLYYERIKIPEITKTFRQENSGMLVKLDGSEVVIFQGLEVTPEKFPETYSGDGVYWEGFVYSAERQALDVMQKQIKNHSSLAVRDCEFYPPPQGKK